MSKPVSQIISALVTHTRALFERPERILRAHNLLASALSSKTITNIDIAGSQAFQENPAAYVIDAGVINVEEGEGGNVASRSAVAVDTESEAATDDLDTINGGRDGMILILRAYHGDRTVVVKDGTDNISLEGGDCSLDTSSRLLALQYNEALSLWLELTHPPGFEFSTITAAYTATISDDVLLCSGTFTVTLYPAADNEKRHLHIKNIGTGTITIDGNAAETIDGGLTAVLAVQYESLHLFCDGSNWHIL